MALREHSPVRQLLILVGLGIVVILFFGFPLILLEGTFINKLIILLMQFLMIYVGAELWDEVR